MVASSETQELGSVRGEQLLVGSYEGCALLESPPHPGPGRIDPADDFDHGVRLGGKERVNVFRPRYRRRHPRGPLAGDTAVEDVRELEPIGELRAFSQNAGDRSAHGAETEERDA